MLKQLVIALLLILTIYAKDSDLNVKKVLLDESYALNDKDEKFIEIPLNDLVEDTTKETLSSHMIIIEAHTQVNSDDVNMNHVVDLHARLKAPGVLDEFLDIKDTFPVQKAKGDGTIVYHYVLYDL